MHYFTKSVGEFLKYKAILPELDFRKTADIDHDSSRSLSNDGVDLDFKWFLVLEREPLQNGLMVR